ncbi:MAG: 2-hydroxyglutaryl-CoA dehydratase [Peptococcaceae bacterium BICA1-7]|nr:MAG: 2-hydroxyglutaryl-CoA dehydratase [Peptococcaceae bacterium BICA1-7]HBV98677.1 2-hydroxyacyl-CoA dehydratase [Desulfotomaculum sp.]
MAEGNKTIVNEAVDLLLEESALKGSRFAERYPGRKAFGFFCSYWPEELVLAAGMEPLRLLPSPGNANPSELPAYSCSLVRGCLSMALQGGFKGLAGVGFAHTCDAMQCLGGIWEETMGLAGTLTVVPPVMLSGAGAGKFFENELSILLNKLGGIAGSSPGEEELSGALDLCEKIRRQVTELDGIRAKLPSDLVAAVMRAGQVMPRKEYSRALEAALPALKEGASDPGGRQRVLVTGAVLETDSLFRMIEDLGGRVVADDTCTGYHHYTGPTRPANKSPLEAIVSRYTGMAPCPCRNRGLDGRTDYLEDLAAGRKAGGAILVIRKYCDPHAWDAVTVAERLRGAGVKTLVLELEASEVAGQERTRLQAFLESL